MRPETRRDIVFLGGGLANGLAAYRLAARRPEVSTLVLEAGETLGGNHTWSFHGGDLTPDQHAWVAPLVSRSWDGTDVAFPSHRRRVAGAYHSLRSVRFHEAVSSVLGERVRLRAPVRAVSGRTVTLESGEAIDGGCVIDGRGWNAAGIPVAWQKFVGVELALAAPHGLERPVLMDATVPQVDGFRFFYALPWDGTHVLLEDTRYSDTPDIIEADYRAEIRAYAKARGWTILDEGRVEAAALPIPLGGALALPPPDAAVSGARGGFFHATTGYSLPDAVRFADDLAALPSFDGAATADWARERSLRHWRSQRFFRMVNRLLFLAAPPETRYRMLEAFYRRDDALVSRFYAGRMSAADRLRMFAGRPPVALGAAFRAALTRFA